MKTLSNAGKKVARRSFAGFMAMLMCATTLGTNFWGLGSKDSESIVGGFEAFAADSVIYGPSQTYYDAGTLVMNAYYDSSTGTNLAETSANYHATDWDVTYASSYVASASQNGNKGVTVISTTDIADSNKYGSASNVVDGGDGKRGIMCFSEYLDALNGNFNPGDADYKAYEKSVPDYEAPAGNDTVTYQYMAEGKTYSTDDGQVEIKWTLFAWPDDQNLDGLSTAAMKAKLDTPEEIKTEWEKVKPTEVTGNNNSVKLDVPGELVSDDGKWQDAGNTGAKDNTSLFYKGQPEWFSGNQGSFDSWFTDDHENYLMNLGLWTRLETAPVKITKTAGTGGYVTYEGKPAVSIAMFKPSNTSSVYQGADVKTTLTEDNDTEFLPLYAYLGDTYASADKLSTMKLTDILKGQASAERATIPTYNIRKQLYAMWETTQASYLKNATSLTCRQISDGATGVSKTWTNINVTGIRLYAIGSYPRIDTTYAAGNQTYVNASAEGAKITVINASEQWNSASQGGEAYGSSDGKNPVLFVFNENDICKANGVIHANNIPGQVFNLSDIYDAYGTDLKPTGTGKVVAEDIANTIVPFVIRSDAYYDVTEDYQRAAGVLYGRVDASTLDTSAINSRSAGKVAIPSANDEIVDTVTYSGLNGGDSYTLEGAVYKSNDKTFASPIVQTTVKFTAQATTGTQNVVFTAFDSSSVAPGEKLVVTEVLKSADGTVIAEHKDLADADQTITYTNKPVLVTKASLSDEDKKITDTVTYSGLDASDEYIMTTTAYDATTGSMLPDSVTTEFTASDTGNGKVDVVYDKFDAVDLAGHKLVMYESVALKSAPNAEVASHKDKNDAEQTVVLGSNMEISTVAKAGTGSKYLDAIDSETIVDTVTVTGLKASEKYTARATLFDVTTGELVTDTSSNTLTWSEEFTTDASGNGSATVTLANFAASNKAGHTLVVYEEILNANGVSVATHADSADEQQTVSVKKAGITTVLGDADGKKDMESSASMIFKDAITYSGLVPGNEYYMVSTLVDKANGQVLTDTAGNKAIVTSTVFTANSTGSNKGSSSFTFANMASTMSGKTVVAFNDLYRVTDGTASGTAVTDNVKAELVASEHDLANVSQTVSIDATIDVTDATIDTVAKGVDGSKTIPLATNSTIKDTVTYTGLTAGKTYTLSAEVYDTNTGKRAAGYTKEQSMDFTAGDNGKGEIVMTIDLNTMELSGHKLVVYETLSLGDKTVASHRDLTDADQTVTVNDTFQASIDTVATDKATGGKTLMASSDAVILDKVSYDGLDTNMSYKLTTTVYDKATGAKCDGIAAVTTEFKPSDSKGTVEVSIPVDGTKFTAGQSLVVYEELTATSKTTGTDGKSATKTVTVATHKDISDADQTVTFVKMTTYLTGDGTSAKTVHVGSDAYAIDTASFTGLTPNRTYVITTQLLDVAANSGAVTLDTNTSANNTASGNAVATRTMEFTPTTANGSIATQINVNTTGLSGHSLVAVATVTDKTTGQTVATHTDKANVDQTITVQTRVEAQTGVGTYAWIFGIMALIMLAGVSSYGIGFYSDKKNGR